MNGRNEIQDFQSNEVVRAYEKALQKGETNLAKNIRANHSDLESRFAKVKAELVIPSGI